MFNLVLSLKDATQAIFLFDLHNYYEKNTDCSSWLLNLSLSVIIHYINWQNKS